MRNERPIVTDSLTQLNEPKKALDLFELEKEYLPQRKAGKDFSDIRKELKSRGVDAQGIRILFDSIERQLITDKLEKQAKQKNLALQYGGLVFMVLGGLVSLLSFLGIIGIQGSYVIAYGPFFGGASMMAVARSQRKMKFRRLND